MEAAVDELAKDVGAAGSFELRQSLQEALFTEECCLVLRQNRKVLEELYAAKGRASILYRCQRADVGTEKLVALTQEVFDDADEDRNGSLSYQEFYTALRQRSVAKRFKDLGLELDDFKVLFQRIDADQDGEVTLAELANGLVKLRRAMEGLDRAIVYLRRLFADADKDGSGTLSFDELHGILQSPIVLLKLQSIGISTQDVDDVWAELEAQEDAAEDGVSSAAMIAGFLSLREDDSKQKRGTNFMRQVFKLADATKNGCLTRSDVETFFDADNVREKLERLGLEVPDWLNIFDAIDYNKDGELSWPELLRGISTLWADCGDKADAQTAPT